MVMRIALLIVCIILIPIAITPGVLEEVVALVFIGKVPFTGYILPAFVMLAIYACALAWSLYVVSRVMIRASHPELQEVARRHRARKKVYRLTNHRATPHSIPAIANRKQKPVTVKPS